jgi:hypothetical protein
MGLYLLRYVDARMHAHMNGYIYPYMHTYEQNDAKTGRLITCVKRSCRIVMLLRYLVFRLLCWFGVLGLLKWFISLCMFALFVLLLCSLVLLSAFCFVAFSAPADGSSFLVFIRSMHVCIYVYGYICKYVCINVYKTSACM